MLKISEEEGQWKGCRIISEIIVFGCGGLSSVLFITFLIIIATTKNRTLILVIGRE